MNPKQIQEYLEAGPPKPPTEEEPGWHMQTICDMIDQFKSRNDREMTAEELIVAFAHMLDVRDWNAALEQYQHVFAAVQHAKEQAERRITLPGEKP
jgi:hypothetical protein